MTTLSVHFCIGISRKSYLEKITGGSFLIFQRFWEKRKWFKRGFITFGAQREIVILLLVVFLSRRFQCLKYLCSWTGSHTLPTRIWPSIHLRSELVEWQQIGKQVLWHCTVEWLWRHPALSLDTRRTSDKNPSVRRTMSALRSSIQRWNSSVEILNKMSRLWLYSYRIMLGTSHSHKVSRNYISFLLFCSIILLSLFEKEVKTSGFYIIDVVRAFGARNNFCLLDLIIK